MPAPERSMGIDGRAIGGEPTRNQRQHREAMARNSSPQGPQAGATQAGGSKAAHHAPRQAQPQQSRPRAASQAPQWDEPGWDRDHDEAAGHRARKLLSGSGSGIHRIGDRVGAMRRWMISERWVKRLAIAVAALAVIFVVCLTVRRVLPRPRQPTAARRRVARLEMPTYDTTIASKHNN